MPKASEAALKTPEARHVSDVLDDWLSEQEAAAAARKSVRTLRKWRYLGTGPPYSFFGKTIRYHKPAFIEHFKRNEITPVPSDRRRR